MSPHVLILSGEAGFGPWARDAVVTAGLTGTLAQSRADADRCLDLEHPDVVVTRVEEIEDWRPVLTRLSDGLSSVPVLGVVGRAGSVDVSPALLLGVGDLMTWPRPAEEFVERVLKSAAGSRPPVVVEHGELAAQVTVLRSVTEAAEEALVRTEAAEARVTLDTERDQLRRARDSLSHSLEVILGTMIGSAESASAGRTGHARRVGQLAMQMSRTLGWSPARARGMELAGLFGDIGLLSLPPDLLATPGPLRGEALSLLQSHAEASAEILEPLGRVGVPVGAVRAHHERLDGSGYPRGLRGRQITLGAQILAVADSFAAMTRDRPHRRALSAQDALVALDQEVATGRLSAKVVAALREVLEPGGGPPIDLTDDGADGDETEVGRQSRPSNPPKQRGGVVSYLRLPPPALSR